MEITISKAREQLSELVNKCAFGGESFVLSRRGKPLAALVPLSSEEVIEEETGNKD